MDSTPVNHPETEPLDSSHQLRPTYDNSSALLDLAPRALTSVSTLLCRHTRCGGRAGAYQQSFVQRRRVVGDEDALADERDQVLRAQGGAAARSARRLKVKMTRPRSQHALPSSAEFEQGGFAAFRNLSS